jgi:riboflavin synthase
MFTGIVSDVGRVVEREGGRFAIACGYKHKSLNNGDSLACDGCCLTLIDVKKGKKGTVVSVEASNETLARTTLFSWKEGRRINLERPLALGDALGGHLVTGHVDAPAMILERHPDGDSMRFVVEAPPGLSRFIAGKGSVALDGVSLTVNEVDGASFGVNIIPYTLAHTAWQDRQPGDLVNLEVDLLARYVARLRE